LFWLACHKATEVAWPQRPNNSPDMAKAKALLDRIGYADGLKTTISFDLILPPSRAALRAGEESLLANSA